LAALRITVLWDAYYFDLKDHYAGRRAHADQLTARRVNVVKIEDAVVEYS